MNFARRLFLIAGIYGLIVLTPQYFLEAKTGTDYPPAITHPEYYYGFVSVAVAWQFLFLVISRNPVRYRLAMLPSILETLPFGIALVWLYLQHRVSSVMLGFGCIDLLLGLLFIIAYMMTPAES